MARLFVPYCTATRGTPVGEPRRNFTRPLGDRRDSCQTAQGGVVAPLQGIEGFCEQRGEDPSRSQQGCEDLHVMLLLLPWLGLLGGDEAGSQGIELVTHFLELSGHKPHAGNERAMWT